MKINFYFVILTISTILSVAFSSQCSFNGYEYSGSLGSTFSALSAADSNDPAGKYTFNWRICSAIPNKGNVSAFMWASASPSIVDNAGLANLGVFSKDSNGNTVVTYQSNGPVCYGTTTSRSIAITLKCGAGDTVISQVSQPSTCKYAVTMSGSAFCTKTACSNNNIDYSSLIGTTFPTTTVADSFDINNKYVALLSVCSGIQSSFNASGVSTLFYLATNPSVVDVVGRTSTGVFSTVNGNSVVHYESNSPVCYGTTISRSIDITLACGSNPSTTVTQITQPSICKYSATLTGVALCPVASKPVPVL